MSATVPKSTIVGYSQDLPSGRLLVLIPLLIAFLLWSSAICYGKKIHGNYIALPQTRPCENQWLALLDSCFTRLIPLGFFLDCEVIRAAVASAAGMSARCLSVKKIQRANDKFRKIIYSHYSIMFRVRPSPAETERVRTDTIKSSLVWQSLT